MLRDETADIAVKAGRILLDHLEKGIEIDRKTGHELVTSADFTSEQFLEESLTSLIPDTSFIGEENWNGSYPTPPFWVVDPLDGTNNYVHGYPMFCVSIALVDQNGVSLGCVHDPVRGETFTASRGNGTTLNGQPVHASENSLISEVLLATGFPYSREPCNLGMNLDVLKYFLGRARGIRRGGSAALDLAYTACGRLGGFWEEHLKPWDMAAGVLLVSEAGGTATGYDGTPWSLSSEGIAAAGSTLFKALREGIDGN